jgi:hypothetical protein
LASQITHDTNEPSYQQFNTEQNIEQRVQPYIHQKNDLLSTTLDRKQAKTHSSCKKLNLKKLKITFHSNPCKLKHVIHWTRPFSAAGIALPTG